ncbi:hypothetical protein DICPUDRAFT_100013 [Dictyostelium purpureum]|uniref:Protein kinase domain-containing protein n=1 Tax=Dictyostelium purpureum TaxID=5786 RepID=F1A4N0_DICPU|nr:uncharacterized protein DICPUDRAFT_100013 [Dictyostelium purpureum]EGC28848.1 hypothetical protein DICPUDRAFT_100013 [Dictyostelium purpureum]|eukprot:XP_003294624.1 hypothetical protein DICPUDRAFT_100013 [Dictyostelium purpureum]
MINSILSNNSNNTTNSSNSIKICKEEEKDLTLQSLLKCSSGTILFSQFGVLNQQQQQKNNDNNIDNNQLIIESVNNSSICINNKKSNDSIFLNNINTPNSSNTSSSNDNSLNNTNPNLLLSNNSVSINNGDEEVIINGYNDDNYPIDENFLDFNNDSSGDNVNNSLEGNEFNDDSLRRSSQFGNDDDNISTSSEDSENIDEILVYTEDIESEKEKRRERLITSPPSFDPHTIYSMSQSLLNCSLSCSQGSNSIHNSASNNDIAHSLNNSNNSINQSFSSSFQNQPYFPINNNNSNNYNSSSNSNSINSSEQHPLSLQHVLQQQLESSNQFFPIVNSNSKSSSNLLLNSFGSSNSASSGLSNIMFSPFSPPFSTSPPMSPPNRNIRSMTFPGTCSSNSNNIINNNNVISSSNNSTVSFNSNNSLNNSTSKINPLNLKSIRRSTDDTTFYNSQQHSPSNNQRVQLDEKTLEQLRNIRKEIYELIERKESLKEKQNLINEGYSENCENFENIEEEILNIKLKIEQLEGQLFTLSPNSGCNASSTNNSCSGNSSGGFNLNINSSINSGSGSSHISPRYNSSSSLTNSLRKFSQELKLELRPLDLRAELYSNTNHHVTSPRKSSLRGSPVSFFEIDDQIDTEISEKKSLEQFESLIELIQENQLHTRSIELKDLELKEKIDVGRTNNIWQVEYKNTSLVLKQPKDSNDPKAKERKEILFNRYQSIQHKNLNLLVGFCGESILYESFKDMTLLYDLLHKDPIKIDMTLFMKIAKDVATAISELHSNGILHGNLTSKSVYIDKFQIVKVSFPKLNASDLNNPSIEPRYMAPEITKMETDQISSSIDVYSYAFVLWEMLTNTIPFRKFNDVSVAAKVAYENLRPRIPTSCPLIVRRLINRCWSPNPCERPAFTDIIKLFDHLEGKLFFSSPGILWSLNHDQEIEKEKQKKLKFDEITEFLRGKKEIKFEEIAICEKIGQGSFANVYSGIWNGFRCAIKILKNENLSHSEKFIKEVASLIQAHHPNVVSFFGACVEPPCIFTEYMEGGNLYEILHVKKIKLDRLMMFKIVQDLALGMEHLHSLPSPMLHRDLTSKNILLDEFKNIKIADFGLATYLNDEMTLAGVCNPRWRAPEITKGLNYNEKIDVYSFGLVVYEIYTGKIPFEGIDGSAAAAKSAYENYRPEIPIDIPISIRLLITKCWAALPDDRPSFTEILHELTLIKPKIIKQVNMFTDLTNAESDEEDKNLNYDCDEEN